MNKLTHEETKDVSLTKINQALYCISNLYNLMFNKKMEGGEDKCIGKKE